eukprot:11418770-Alexandrium_andersonii.AAC.1
MEGQVGVRRARPGSTLRPHRHAPRSVVSESSSSCIPTHVPVGLRCGVQRDGTGVHDGVSHVASRGLAQAHTGPAVNMMAEGLEMCPCSAAPHVRHVLVHGTKLWTRA